MTTFKDTMTFQRRVKHVRDDDGATTWRTVDTACRVELAIDLPVIMRTLGQKALASRRKRSTALHGAIVLRLAEVT